MVTLGVLESYFYLFGKGEDIIKISLRFAILQLHPSCLSLIFENEVYMETLMEKIVSVFIQKHRNYFNFIVGFVFSNVDQAFFTKIQ